MELMRKLKGNLEGWLGMCLKKIEAWSYYKVSDRMLYRERKGGGHRGEIRFTSIDKGLQIFILKL